MGYNQSNSVDAQRFRSGQKTIKAIDLLKSHPNYKDQLPIIGEGLITFTLRCAAHLVSPPKDAGESYDVECTQISSGILSLKDEISKKWKTHIELLNNS